MLMFRAEGAEHLRHHRLLPTADVLLVLAGRHRLVCPELNHILMLDVFVTVRERALPVSSLYITATYWTGSVLRPDHNTAHLSWGHPINTHLISLIWSHKAIARLQKHGVEPLNV